MFNKLIASGPQRRRTWTPGAVTVSVVVHLLLLAGAVYASVGGPPEVKEVEEEVTFVELEPNEPEPAKAPEPPPVSVAPPPPQGFQELIPPIEPPSIIPIADPSQAAIDVADFSGIGVAGGTAEGTEGGTPQNTADESAFAYEVAVLDSPPKLANLRQVQTAMERAYPRRLLEAGISGTVVMEFVIQADGRVDASSLKIVSATNPQFTEASLGVVERFRFQAGRYKGEPVRVLIRMPITWETDS